LTIDNVAVVRNAYQIAERKDLEAWIDAFTPDGVFTDNLLASPAVAAGWPT
jgi:ketosteroid isomerase-like protein